MKDDFIGNIINKAIDEAPAKTLLLISDFSQFDPTYVSKLFSAATEDGRLLRLANGIYMKAVHSPFGTAMPSMMQVAQAIAERDHVQILPVGATAENLFGLSEQVPMKATFLTSGSGRSINIAGKVLQFKRGVPRNFAFQDKDLAALCLALKSIGQGNLTDQQLSILHDVMKHYKGNDAVRADIQLMPMWIRKILIKILNDIEKQ